MNSYDFDDFDDDQYQDAYWCLISFAYQKLKETPVFKNWRYHQFDCQFGKCAICGKPMDRYGYHGAQVDHIIPRYLYGTNYSDNLCLVHGECNQNKGTSTGLYPDWAIENPYADELDEEAWRILKDLQPDFPDEVPDELLEAPTITSSAISRYDSDDMDFEDLEDIDETKDGLDIPDGHINLDEIPF